MDSFLVEPDWLQPRLEQPGVAVIDCNWYAPGAEKSGFDTFLEGHIPGARHFDLRAASDNTSPNANMLPSPDRFAVVVGHLGIGNGATVIVYDATYVSARVWWMFRLFGHEKVAVLNGGWRRWKAERRPVQAGPSRAVSPATFTARRTVGEVADWREVLEALCSSSSQVVDARVKERFTGELPSGYPGVPPGHMPGAVNLPWTRMVRQSGDFGFEPPEVAEGIFREVGIDPDKPIVATCGSGVTAAVLAFQLMRMGNASWKIYDGSWNEWGRRDDLPKESV